MLSSEGHRYPDSGLMLWLKSGELERVLNAMNELVPQ